MSIHPSLKMDAAGAAQRSVLSRIERIKDLMKKGLWSQDHAVTGLPKTITIASEEIREALSEPIRVIVESVRMTLEKTPPELSADLIDRGIVMAGGGSLLRGLDKLLAEETGLPVHVAENPMTAVALGVGKGLDDIRYLRTKIAISNNGHEL